MSRVRSPVLVGRDAELAVLADALEDALSGRLATVLVVGEAGIGKTRLVEEFLHGRAAHAGALRLIGGCLDVGAGGVPFAPYLELLRHLHRVLPIQDRSAVFDPVAEAIAPLFPTGTWSTGRPEPSSSGGEDVRRARLFGGALDALAGAATLQPTVLVIEDLHWADRSSLELTAFLLRNLRAARVMAILTTRSDEPARDPARDDLMAMIVRDGNSHRLDLRGLSRDDMRRQVEAIGGDPITPGAVDAVHLRSGGNPFLAEELVALAATGDRTGVPAAAQDILLARLAALSPGAQALVAAAAIGGANLRTERLRAVVDLSDATVRAAIDEATGTSILIRRSDEHELAFRHALGREVVAADLLAGERRRLHARWATVLQAAADDEPTLAGEIARHLDLAGQAELALPWYLREAESAAAALAFDRAGTAYERAIEIFRMGPPDRDALGAVPAPVLALAASALRFSGRAVEAVALTVEQIGVLPPDDLVGRAIALERLGTFQTEMGDDEGALAATSGAVELLRDGPPEAYARALISHVITLVHVVRHERAPAILEPAFEIARRADLPAIESMAYCQRGLVRAMRGDLVGAADDLERSWDLALRSGDTEAILLIALDRPQVSDAAGDYRTSLRLCLEGIAVADRIGAIGSVDALGMLTNAAAWLWDLGRWDEAEEQLLRAQTVDALGRVRDDTLLLRARIAAHRGAFDEARASLALPRVMLGPQVDVYHVLIAGEIALLAGEPDIAIRAAVDALDLVAPVGNLTGLRQRSEATGLGVTAAANALARIRDPKGRAWVWEAVGALIAALDAAEAALPPAAARPMAAAWRAEITAGLARLDGHDDPDAWSDAAAAWATLHVPYRAAWNTVRHAEALLSGRGQRLAATGLLRSARETAVRLGAAPLREEIDALARRGRIELGPHDGASAIAADDPLTPARRYGLTEREAVVLGLLVAGRSNRGIAEVLFISPKTAGVHVGNILGKLGVRGRVEAATVALREGLVEK